MSAINSVIFGVEGKQLKQAEAEFFNNTQPLGCILFARNIQDRAQVKDLINQIRESVGRDDMLFLVDQEGGRVARLRPPHFGAYPAAKIFADIAETNKALAHELLYKNIRVLAHELYEIGFNVNCAPVADILFPGADAIIGDRAYGKTVEQVVEMAAIVCRALQDGGVMPVIKHIPGHGRANVDSHKALPVVSTDYATLRETDFAVFAKLKDFSPFAMTAHIVYAVLDANLPATFSQEIISMIRKDIGYNGVIMTDDLSMHALSGSFASRARKSLQAGCDLVLHCNGNMAEMQEIATEIVPINSRVVESLQKNKAPLYFDLAATQADLYQELARIGEHT